MVNHETKYPRAGTVTALTMLTIMFVLLVFSVMVEAGVKAPRMGNSPTAYFPVMSPGTSQVKAFTNTTGQSAALASTTKMVRLVATQNCHVKVGTNPTAVADGTSMYILQNSSTYISVEGGEKIAVIRDSADGNLFITEAANSP